MLWWIQVEADHVRGLGFEVWIVRLHVAFESMRLHTGAGPRRLHMVVMDLQHTRQLPRAPMRAAVRRPLLRLGQNARFQRWSQHRRLLSLVGRSQAVEPTCDEAPPPAIAVIAVAPQRRLDRRV